jgi:hypothetical protein
MIVDGTTDDLIREAESFGRYLVGETLPARAGELYARVLGEQHITVSMRDRKRLRYIAQHPWSVGLLDAGLSLSRNPSEVRRRLYVLFSILETQPELHGYFLSQERPGWYVVIIILRGCVAVCRSVTGLCFMTLVGL